MKPFSDRMILAWLAGALDPPLARRLEDELCSDPALRARVEALRSRASEPAERPRWRLPPRGVPVGLGATVTAERALHGLGSPGLGDGDLVGLHLELPDDTPRQVVVLTRQGAGWEVLLPRSADEVVPLDALWRDPGGRRVLYLSVDAADAAQLRAVLLAPLDLPVDWAAAPEARWRTLMALLDQGEIPVIVLDLAQERRGT